MTVVRKTVAERGDGMEFVLSDATVDRYGDIVEPTGWQLAKFKRNPIALFGHSASFPIGTWQNVRVEGGRLLGQLVLAAQGTSARIDELRGLVAATSGSRLITCSALLDLLNTDDLDELASVMAQHRVRGLFSLTVDGSLAIEPSHRSDTVIATAFNAHQARQGRPGPGAGGYLAQRCAQAGLVVRQAQTPWLLGAGAEALIERLLTERGDAAVEQQPELAAEAQQWLGDRRASLAVGSLRLQVGHVDLVVLPAEGR